MIVIGLHILAGLFWLLSSFGLAMAKGAGSAKMFRWQMAAATLAIFTGGGLWSMFIKGLMGPPVMVLAAGGVLAVVAAGVQGALVGGPARRMKSGVLAPEIALRKIALGQRLGAGLLAVTLVTMFAAPHLS
jgi:hypothetical protein